MRARALFIIGAKIVCLRRAELMAMQWTLQVFELATLLLLLSSSTVKAEG